MGKLFKKPVLQDCPIISIHKGSTMEDGRAVSQNATAYVAAVDGNGSIAKKPKRG
jgi:hypothetical protein